ncbi:MAG: CopD family protein [Geminicoccaceae bacterium]
MSLPALLVAIVVAVVSPIATAAAHAVLVEARPADGQRLDAAPQALELAFSEPVSPIAIRLFDGHGRLVEGADIVTEGNRIALRPAAALPTGAYLLSYRVTSLDGHPVGASIRFGIGAAPSTDEADTEGDGARVAGIVARLAVSIGLLGASGLLLFVRLLDPPAAIARRSLALARSLALLAGVAALLRLGFAGLELEGLPLASLPASLPWTTAAATSLGPSTLLALAGACCAAVATKVDGWPTATLALGVTALAFASTGHAATAPPRIVSAPALGLHVLAAAFWFGSFLPLAWILGGNPLVAAAIVRRFSAMVGAAVALLAASGAALATIQLGGRIGPLWSTAYGLTLSAKLGIVAALLGIAWINRTRLTPRLEHDAAAATRLRRLVLVDLALATAVLAITASFPLNAPPRALEAVVPDDASATTVVQAGGSVAIISFLPGRSGPNRFEAIVSGADGAPLVARAATLRIGSPAHGIEPLRSQAAMRRPGAYVVDTVEVPLAGSWDVRLDLLIDDFTQRTFETRIDIR